MEENIITQTQIAFHNLNGLINGIAMDGHISKSEYDALKSWCQTHHGLCSIDEFNSFYQEIKDKIQGGVLGSEEIIELKEIIAKYSPHFAEADQTKADLHFLQGVCYGIMADGDINKYELNLLQKWLNDNDHLKDIYPFDEITAVVKKAIEAGKLDQEEYQYLSKYFMEFLKID